MVVEVAKEKALVRLLGIVEVEEFKKINGVAALVVKVLVAKIDPKKGDDEALKV